MTGPLHMQPSTKHIGVTHDVDTFRPGVHWSIFLEPCLNRTTRMPWFHDVKVTTVSNAIAELERQVRVDEERLDTLESLKKVRRVRCATCRVIHAVLIASDDRACL